MGTDYNQRAAEAIDPQNKVGRVVRLYGKHGEVVVQRWDGFPDRPALLWIEAEGIGTPIWARSCVGQGVSKAVVVFEEFESESLAEHLVGRTLYAEGAARAEEETDGLELLIGFGFRDLTSGLAGRVAEAYDNDINPLLGVVLDGEEEERLVPWADALIEQLDGKKRKLVMRLAEGFFE